MNNPIGPTDNEFLNYLSWCEAQEIEPFGEDETPDDENTKDENNEITIDKPKTIRKGRMINNE